MKAYSTISSCRLCGHKELESLFSLGDHHINDFPEGEPTTPVCPLELVQCQGPCGLVQLRDTANFQQLYENHYWYKSGINEKIVNDLQEIAEIATSFMSPGDTLIDIGANDGTLLSFVSPEFNRVAVEPARNMKEDLDSIADDVHQVFWEDYKGEKAKAITAIGMMYDSEDPLLFVRTVKDHLEEYGVFIAQLMTNGPMVRNLDLGNICHEHLEYYDFKSLKYMYEEAGLEIFRIEENDINGGSYRIYARHLNYGSRPFEEKPVNWAKFKRDIDKNLKLLKEYLNKCDGVIYGYGASTKGNVILKYAGLGVDYLDGVADRNPEKVGKYMLNGVQITDEDEARENATHLLILPYGFVDVFKERESEFINNGGTFLIPLPKFHAFTKREASI